MFVLLYPAETAVERAIEVKSDCDPFLLVFVLRSVEATVETDTARDVPTDMVLAPTVETETPLDVLFEPFSDVVVEPDVALEVSPERFVDSTVEPEPALDTLFDRSADSTVDNDVAFEAFFDNPPLSVVEACVFIDTVTEISVDCIPSMARKSFLVTSVPSGKMKFMSVLLKNLALCRYIGY